MSIESRDLDEEILAEPDELSSSPDASDIFLFLQSNGWYILITSLLLYYFWNTKISPELERRKQIKYEQREAEKLKKDPDLYKARDDARKAAMERLQNAFNEQVAEMKKLNEEKENKKRQEFISRHSFVSPGRKLNGDDQYNPLMGKSGPSYRAPRPTCPGGSCGNR